MKKLDAKVVLQAMQESNGNPQVLAEKLECSLSHAYYLLRTRNAQASANDSSEEVVEQAEAVINSDINNRPECDAVHVMRTRVEFSAFVPPVDPRYKAREVDADIERYAERGDFATVLVGEAGSGKTYAVQQYAARKGLPFLRVACDDSVMLREMLGKREIKQGTTFFKFGLLLEFLQEPCVILFDEFNALPSGKLFFLHEILDKMSDGHKVFVKEADAVVNINKGCKVFLACNPNGARYSGTNKLNVALADRPRIVQFNAFEPSEVKEFFDCGDKAVTDSLKRFYIEARKLIAQTNMRAVFSLRSVKRIAESIKAGDSVAKALEHNFFNMALLTASEREREQLESLAKVQFGLAHFGGVQA